MYPYISEDKTKPRINDILSTDLPEAKAILLFFLLPSLPFLLPFVSLSFFFFCVFHIIILKKICTLPFYVPYLYIHIGKKQDFTESDNGNLVNLIYKQSMYKYLHLTLCACLLSSSVGFNSL